ncbi:MAG TPA: hypothetical protein VMH26_19635, partial [Burkholderiales bacterium]|nr:hypothetical protein [Burkholderiales bacterium]
RWPRHALDRIREGSRGDTAVVSAGPDGFHYLGGPNLDRFRRQGARRRQSRRRHSFPSLRLR